MNTPCPRCAQPYQDWTGEMCPECYLKHRQTPAGALEQYESALETWRQEVKELHRLEAYEGKVVAENAEALTFDIYMQACRVETALSWMRYYKTRRKLVRRKASAQRASKQFDYYRITPPLPAPVAE